MVFGRMAEDSPLTAVERLALRFAEAANDTPRGKWLQTQFLRGVSYAWVRACLDRTVVMPGGEGGTSGKSDGD